MLFITFILSIVIIIIIIIRYYFLEVWGTEDRVVPTVVSDQMWI